MTTEIDTLAEEYWAHYHGRTRRAHTCSVTTAVPGSSRRPRWRRRTGEIAALRSFAQRAEAVDEAGLDEQQRITRAVLASDATTRADMTQAAVQGAGRGPDLRRAGLDADPDGDAGPARRGRRRGARREVPRDRPLLPRARRATARRRGARARSPPRSRSRDTIAQLDGMLAKPVADDPLLTTTPPPAGLDVDGWKARLRAVIESDVRPGMAAYRDVLRDEVLAGGRPDDQCGLRWLPDGEDGVRRHAALLHDDDKSAQEIHEIGLAQIEKLADEYRALGPEVVGTDDLAADLRGDAHRPEAALRAPASSWSRPPRSRCSAPGHAMPEWFEVLPQAPCGVQATMTGAKAFYFPPASDGSRGGTFFVNVADPTAWGTFELESMAFHEGIPGHHLQIAIASELERRPGVPQAHPQLGVRRGLGALHRAALRRDGALQPRGRPDGDVRCRLDARVPAGRRHRAARAGLEPGAGGRRTWSPTPRWPRVCPTGDRPLHRLAGQATSYMVGRLEIQRMRAEAEQRQGVVR